VVITEMGDLPNLGAVETGRGSGLIDELAIALAKV
jgi:hypothetical protein